MQIGLENCILYAYVCMCAESINLAPVPSPSILVYPISYKLQLLSKCVVVRKSESTQATSFLEN